MMFGELKISGWSRHSVLPYALIQHMRVEILIESKENNEKQEIGGDSTSLEITLQSPVTSVPWDLQRTTCTKKMYQSTL